MIDGPGLRSVRLACGKGLREVARRSGLTPGHLSKVERGEVGRQVTPAVVLAYEYVTGVALREGAVDLSDAGVREKLTYEGTVRGHVASLSGLAFGQPLERSAVVLLRSMPEHWFRVPNQPTEEDVETLAHVVEYLVTRDGLAGPLAAELTRWVARLLDDPVPVPDRMWRPVATLALRAVGDSPVGRPAGSFGRLLHAVAVRAAFYGGLRCEVLTAIGRDLLRQGCADEGEALVRLGRVFE